MDPGDVILIHHLILIIDAIEEGKEDINIDLHMRSVRTELLESACFNIQHGYYKNFFEQASIFTRSLVKNHAFVDGNKRAGAMSLFIFLGLNGYELCVTDDQLIRKVLDIARGYITVDSLRKWINKKSRKMSNGDNWLDCATKYENNHLRSRLAIISNVAVEQLKQHQKERILTQERPKK